MALVDVLIPTHRRRTGLAIVLTGLLDQTFQDFDVTVSDQTDDEVNPKFGGCGILPSGTYHLGLPTTVVDRAHNATELFSTLLREQGITHDITEFHEERERPQSFASAENLEGDTRV